MNLFDYYHNPKITARINALTYRIASNEDREDCRQEIWAELYDFMPMTDDDAIRLIEKVAKRYKRNRSMIYANESSIEAIFNA